MEKNLWESVGKVTSLLLKHPGKTTAGVLVWAILSLSLNVEKGSLEEWWRRNMHPGYQWNGKYGPTGMYYDEVTRWTIPSADLPPETAQ